jgi:hypothetical protein
MDVRGSTASSTVGGVRDRLADVKRYCGRSPVVAVRRANLPNSILRQQRGDREKEKGRGGGAG